MPDRPYCTRKVTPGEPFGGRCTGDDGCGHLLVVHVGVDHCPVCELVDLAHRRSAQALADGSMTINQHRAKLGAPPITDADRRVTLMDAAWRLANEGHLVHYVSAAGSRCLLGRTRRVTPGRVTFTPTAHDACTPLFGADFTCTCDLYDPSGQAANSWHWPCDGDREPAKPGPADPAPVSITVNVQGSVLSERDLRDVIEKQMSRLGMRRRPDGDPRY